MIGLLKGKIYSKHNNSVILLTGGVGYLVFLGDGVISNIKPDEEKIFFIHTHVREDVLDLYGFESPEQKKLFEILLSISGIGPKTALAISDKDIRQITMAVKRSDVDFFTSVPRLGKKNAQKIIIELKSKLKDSEEFTFENESEDTTGMATALQSMGFDMKEIKRVLFKLDNSLPIEDKLRQALKQLGKSV
jgi:Holliday junction DNA helicase RuvA